MTLKEGKLYKLDEGVTGPFGETKYVQFNKISIRNNDVLHRIAKIKLTEVFLCIKNNLEIEYNCIPYKGCVFLVDSSVVFVPCQDLKSFKEITE